MTSVWRVSVTLGGSWYLMCRNGRYAPLCVHTFRVFAMGIGRRYEDLRAVSERLRWCRYRLGLMQKEAAQRVGISQTLYEEMERGDCREYPSHAVDKLARLYQVPVEDLLDGYSRFLYGGPIDQIRCARERLGLSRKGFAELAEVGEKSVRDWEMGRKRVSKRSWERIKAILIL